MTRSNRLAVPGILRIATLALLTAAAGSALAQTTTWDYKSYRKNAAGQWDKDNFTVGTISLTEKDGQAWFRMKAGRLDVCYGNDLPATVTRTAELTKIEVSRVIPGCEEFRYSIKNDGSGGTKETKVGERWVPTRFDHGLTPSK